MTLYEKLIAASLPVQSATDQGAISFLPGVTLTAEQEEIFHIIILEHFNKFDKLTRLQIEKSAVTGYAALPEWMKTWTAQDAENYINSQIFSGWTQAQAETWIDTNLTNITSADVSQINSMLAGIRAGMKLIACWHPRPCVDCSSSPPGCSYLSVTWSSGTDSRAISR